MHAGWTWREKRQRTENYVIISPLKLQTAGLIILSGFFFMKVFV